MFGTPLDRRSLEVLEMDIISRYLYFIDGYYIQVFIFCRWILYTGIYILQMDIISRYSYSVDGYYIQVFIFCRWILYQGIYILQMDIISRYLYSVDGCYIKVFIFCRQILYQGIYIFVDEYYIQRYRSIKLSSLFLLFLIVSFWIPCRSKSPG